MHAERPYGSWPSSLSPAVLTSGNARLSFPTLLEDGSSAWLEGRPSEGGRQVIVHQPIGEAARDVLPPPWNARTRVHEYGGLSFVFAPKNAADPRTLYFVHDADQQIYVLREGAMPVVVTHAPGSRFAELIVDVARRRLIAVRERHEASREAENTLVAIDLDHGELSTLASGHDFFAAPALSPDGNTLAYLAWDHPHMPWDAARVFVARLHADGSADAPTEIAGGPDGSAFQPTWSPRGELYFALESRDSPWAIHRLRGGAVELAVPSKAEWAAPLWNLGTRLFAFANEEKLVGAAFDQGLTSWLSVNPESGDELTRSAAFPHIGQLDARGDKALLSLGWAGSGNQLAEIDLVTGQSKIVRDTLAPLFAGSDPRLTEDDVSRAEPVSFPTTNGDIAHANFYAPKSRNFRGPKGDLPPLLVLAHGGPTGCANAATQLGVQYFTTRGFAVLDVNYRGSVGFGRAYREKLRTKWGVVDVDDCALGALAMAGEGRVDRRLLAIRGGSAGGFTVLMALVQYPDVFAAGTCLYGISDPRTLTAETHKFESRYDQFLFGEGEARERAFDERAPLRRADSIRTPVIFFQGLEDKAVPASQTEGLYRALRERGVDTEYYGYAGEQHGFRKAETIIDVFEKESAFHERVLFRSKR